MLPDGIDWDALAKRRAGPGDLHGAEASGRDRARGSSRRDARRDEPVAIVSKATTPGQRVLRTTLARAAADAAAAAIEPPAIVAVGPVGAISRASSIFSRDGASTSILAPARSSYKLGA